MASSGPADPERVAQARALVRQVLQGRETAASNPALVADDVLTTQVAIVEQHDPAWLQTELSDLRHPKERRLQVALQLRGPLRRPLLIALGAPPFIVGRG